MILLINLKVLCPTDMSSGTTSIIRKKLNFTDEALWRQFSSRRLHLVEMLSLSSKKASEQDEEIRQCAKNLMKEFDFPMSTLPEFDKLVRLAIQSVRRNKKRSEKRLASKLETSTSDDDNVTVNGPKRSKQSEHISMDPSTKSPMLLANYMESHNLHDEHANNLHFLSSIIIDEESNLQNTQHICSGASKNENNQDDFSLVNEPHSPLRKFENADSRLAVNSLVGPVIKDNDKLPSLRRIDENPEFSKSSQKILHTIKNSKSCFEFSQNANNEYKRSANYNLLEEFGSMCITSAILFTLEKWFDHLLPDSSSYIKLRLKSDSTLALIIKNLDKSSVEVNGLSEFVASQLFKKLIGGCVKDFGFDSTLNPLCDIFHSVILRDYPIISRDQKIGQHSKQYEQPKLTKNKNFFTDSSIIDATIYKPKSKHSFSNVMGPVSPESGRFDAYDHDIDIPKRNKTVLSNSKSIDVPDFPLSTAHIPIPPFSEHNSHPNLTSLSHTLNPPILRSKQYTQVTIKFNDKELKFRYSVDSNAPPTIMELISNCKQVFGIINSTRVLNLRNARSGNTIKNDHELERILRMAAILSPDGNGEATLELIFANLTQGYLNLNYEPSKSVTVSPELMQKGDVSSSASHIESTANLSTSTSTVAKPTIEATAATNSLISRYLPPPRPAMQDNNSRGIFMKFQPLL